jgi:hypothetical protein
MSTINSSSTLAQVQAAYDDNASYDQDNDPGKAKAFLTACRILLSRLPHSTSMGMDHTQLNTDLIAQQMQDARNWLAVNDTASSSPSGPRSTRTSFENFRA